jgi:hypothetical protein
MPPYFELPHAVIEPSAGAPIDSGYTKIYSNALAFAALKADGSITIDPSALRVAKAAKLA